MQNLASVHGGWLKRGADVLYKSADDDIRKKLAFLLDQEPMTVDPDAKYRLQHLIDEARTKIREHGGEA